LIFSASFVFSKRRSIDARRSQIVANYTEIILQTPFPSFMPNTHSIYMKSAIPTASAAPMVRAYEVLMEVAEEAELGGALDDDEEEPVPVPESLPEPVPLAGVDPLVPPPVELLLPGRLAVAFLASAWKFSSVLVAFALGLTLMTMVIPFWQCLPWEQ